MIWNKKRIRIFQKLENKMNFRTRLFLSFLTVAIPVLFIATIVSYYFLSKSAEGEMLNSLTIMMERLTNQIEVVTSETENLSRNIIYDRDVQQLLQKAKSGEEYPNDNDVSYFINSFIVNREYIHSVVLMSEDKTLFSTEKAYTNISTIDQIKKKWWFSQLEKEVEPYVWYKNPLSETNFRENQDNTIMLTRVIRSLEDYKTPIGRMMIYISKSYINGVLNEVDWGNTTNIWVIDHNNQVILENNLPKDYSFLLDRIVNTDTNEVINIDNKKYVIGKMVFKNSDWSLLIATPFSEVNSGLGLIKVQMVVIIAIVMIIILLMSILHSNSMARPIHTLSKVMNLYNGKLPKIETLEIDDYNSRKDEIGVMYRSYEKLVERMELLIKEVYIKDLEKKDAELALLETQINPHFLYNTLDSINWMALANGQEKISEMVTALADTFRLSLTKNNSSFVDMEHELQYIESYLTIQKLRFGDRLVCTYEIQEEVKGLQILRFILQPIVENSIKHGISISENGGSINIKAQIHGEILYITILNDGINIDLKQMDKYLEFDVSNTEYLSFQNKGYGIQNINRRIKIIHGMEFGIQYDIVNKVQTACVIRLPKTISH